MPLFGDSQELVNAANYAVQTANNASQTVNNVRAEVIAIDRAITEINKWIVSTQNTINSLILKNNKTVTDLKAHSDAIELLKAHLALIDSKDSDQDKKYTELTKVLDALKNLGTTTKTVDPAPETDNAPILAPEITTVTATATNETSKEA
jgi:septal ring factor EnvC (AmiA/AmiB activator)